MFKERNQFYILSITNHIHLVYKKYMFSIKNVFSQMKLSEHIPL